MKLRSPHLWIGLFSAIGVISVAVVDVRRTSPGELAAVHGAVPELAGSDGCSGCHGGWTTSMREACLECHAVIGEQIQAGDGLHGVLGERKASTCALCHSDHHGAGFALVNMQGFRQAGVRERDEFDHALIGFPMDGKHLELECKECHENADERILPAGEHRFLGLDQDCASCHDDPHEGSMQIACAECHAQRSFDELGSRGHERILPLVGGHGDVACRVCHAQGEAWSLELLGRKQAPPERTCRTCHESPHRKPFLRGAAQLAGMSAATACVVCHAAEHTSFRDEALALSAEQHACSGFPLDVPHDTVSCADCHASELATFRERYPGRDADGCVQCHDDPHGGQFESGAFAGQGCLACHARVEFEPHAFTVESHERTAFQLTGSHVDTDCNDCHEVPGEGLARQFHGTPGKCEDCHADVHDGFFDEAAAASFAPAPDGGECARCHGTGSFSELAEDFDHGRWTGFPVLGAHAEAGCESCHPRDVERDESGRTFGRVAEHFGAFEGCVTCHIDPHRGSFDRSQHPRVIEGRAGCARCHVQTSFRALEGFDHRLWTGFPLEDAHAAAGCTACHAPLAQPDEFGRTWERAAGRLCSDCHEDPHQDQFRRAGRTECQRCHESAASFSVLAFHHERDSRFQLGEAHTPLACSACHKPETSGDGTEFVRYRPMGRECVDCHGVSEDPLRRKKGKR